MTLNCQTYLKKLLKRFYVASIPVKPLAKFLKDGAEVLALPLRGILNFSIKSSTFPEKCRIVKLKPIFKKGERPDPKNYRPISHLPLVSQIIEKSIHFQIEDYLNKNKLIYMY